jgi:hypothetical protein
MKAIDIIPTAAFVLFVLSMAYIGITSLHHAAISAFRLGCHSSGATIEVVEQCRALAESKVGIL